MGGKNFIVGGNFWLADIAAGCVCGCVDGRFSEYPRRERWRELAGYYERLKGKQSFKNQVPVPQIIKDMIV